jgi:hypothetical protein
MAKTAKCPECGEMFDPRGLPLHRKAAHGVDTGMRTVREHMSRPKGPTCGKNLQPENPEQPEVEIQELELEVQVTEPEPKDDEGGIGFW